MRPPEVRESYDDCSVMVQAKLIAYDQIRQTEETKEKVALAGARVI